jgi:CubicO group peptidase (beta-lactamase class C family)
MRPRDMAKIGQLVLNHGRWNDVQIVSDAWIDTATAAQIKRSQSDSYGYQFWLGSSHVSDRQIDWVAAVGQGGQRIFIVPSLDLVIVVTAGNYYGNDLLSSLVPKIVRDDYVLPAVEGVP